MRDVGPDISRGRGTRLASAAQKQFLENWLQDNEGNFVEVMDLIKDGAPVKYAELYLKAKQMTMAKETNINVSVSRQQDYDNLQALVRTRVTPGLPQSGSYTPYEEIQQTEPLKREEEERL